MKSCEACEVTPGFGMACTKQNTALAGHHRKNMTWLHDILGLRIRFYRGTNRGRPVRCRYTGGDTLGCLDGNGEIGFHLGFIITNHQWQAQLPATLFGQGQTN